MTGREDSLTARLAFALATGIVLPEKGKLPVGCELMYKQMLEHARELEHNTPGNWTIGDLCRKYLSVQMEKARQRGAAD